MITEVTQAVIAFTGVCTFCLTLFIAVQAMRIHSKTDELVIHTNSLTDKLIEKTDKAGVAAGIEQEKGRVALLSTNNVASAEALASILSAALVAAADVAAAKVLAAAKLAKEEATKVGPSGA